MQRGHNRRFAMAEDLPEQRDRRPLDDSWWEGKRPALESINVPALVCASWSDHGLHTRGSLEGFERIGSHDKWLFTHGRRKWQTFYSTEARDVQRRFFDRYVKGENNGWERTARVRLEVRKTRDEMAIRSEDHWPLAAVRYQPLYLDAAAGRLVLARPSGPAAARYQPTRARGNDRVLFSYRFEADSELTGSMALKLWVSTSVGDDLDLFVVLRKRDGAGKEVYFYGYNGFNKDGVAKGWLRASHRETDPTRSRPGRPWHTHRAREPLTPGQIVPVENRSAVVQHLLRIGFDAQPGDPWA
jgi:putative CocE/NonD family hydrolase